ncbi:hypothetical protein PILCRDRAFT_826403 [Piloderma croceum F 1598]|uniref:Uncharacterized protein n=1 Tax=Piloderma croceum (strain F 1598) TaxID=765440 RepID=A0A0C3F8W7_PILCF|nr:hypothetical protein PILCRDRAFT_826403 [Piloderma croceum F 1598]
MCIQAHCLFASSKNRTLPFDSVLRDAQVERCHTPSQTVRHNCSPFTSCSDDTARQVTKHGGLVWIGELE